MHGNQRPVQSHNIAMKLVVVVGFGAHMEEKVQTALQNNSGGNFDNFIHKEFSGRIPYYTILTINILVGKTKFPTTTVLQGNFSFFFLVCH